MAANPGKESIDEAIEAAVEAAVTHALPTLRRLIESAVAARVQAGSRVAPRRNVAVRAGAITRWVADQRARRVPTFVIEATGLDTKKQIVARYGVNAAFAKGKPLPHVKLAPAEPAKERVVKARPPIVRKAGAPR